MTFMMLPNSESNEAWDLVLSWMVRNVREDAHTALCEAVRAQPGYRALYRGALQYLTGNREVFGKARVLECIVRAPEGLSAFAEPSRICRLPHRGDQRARLILRQEEGCAVAQAGSAIARAPFEQGRVVLAIDEIAGEIEFRFEVVEPNFESAMEVIAAALMDGDTQATIKAAGEYLRWAEPLLRAAASGQMAAAYEDLSGDVHELIAIRVAVETLQPTMSQQMREAIAHVDKTLWEHRRAVQIVEVGEHYDILREHGFVEPSKSPHPWWER